MPEFTLRTGGRRRSAWYSDLSRWGFRGVHAYYAPDRLKVSWAEMLLAEPPRNHADPASGVQDTYINSLLLIFVCINFLYSTAIITESRIHSRTFDLHRKPI
jgi:hypothetical protein